MARLVVGFLAILFAVGCYGPDPKKYGTKTAATRGCRDPQTVYHQKNVGSLGMLGLAAWRPQTDLAQTPDVEVLCEDFTSDCLDFHIMASCGVAAGYFTLGTDEVHVDHGRANGEFAFSGVENHELVHWYLSKGPHPERARLHVCPCHVSSDECWPGGCGVALMNPTLAGLGTTTATMWNGDTEAIDVGRITQNVPTDLDRQFAQWAMTP